MTIKSRGHRSVYQQRAAPSQATGFLLAPDASIVNAVYSSGPIGRLVPDDVAGMVAYTARDRVAKDLARLLLRVPLGIRALARLKPERALLEDVARPALAPLD